MLLSDIDTAFLQDDARTVAHDVDVLLRDGRIAAVGADLADAAEGTIVDCSDRVVVPGLINCHTHTPGLLTRGWSDDATLFDWLKHTEDLIGAADREVKRAATRLSAASLVRSGTTTINDMWNTYLVEDLLDVGVRALLGHAMAETESTPEDIVEQGLAANREFLEAYADHPTVHPTVPVHSVYRGTADLIESAHGLAAATDTPFHVHVSETRAENDRCREHRGTTPTGWLEDLGVLDDRSVLAHCVHLTDRDRRLIAERGAGVAHCPSANLKLGSGIADIPALDDAATTDGVPVGLGTDGAASNNALNPIREGRTAALLHKREDPGAMTAQRVLDMLTREGAAVLGMADEIGSIEAGKRADLVLLDAEDPTLRPHFGDEGLRSNLVYSYHGRVEATIVEGEFVVRDGHVLAELEEAVEAVQSFTDRVLEAADRPG
ncbi:MAG: amidohydrolase family protein [Halobacteriaceae archaeon]